MAVITIPRVLREKLGDDGAEALAEVIKEVERESHKELATKGDLLSVESKLERKIDALEWKLKLYFLILLFTIILVSPGAFESIARFLGVIK